MRRNVSGAAVRGRNGAGERAEEKRAESDDERRAREIVELLWELRIVIPGVQVLLAFLLTVPFAGSVTDLRALQRGVFFAVYARRGYGAPHGRLVRRAVVRVLALVPP